MGVYWIFSVKKVIPPPPIYTNRIFCHEYCTVLKTVLKIRFIPVIFFEYCVIKSMFLKIYSCTLHIRVIQVNSYILYCALTGEITSTPPPLYYYKYFSSYGKIILNTNY